MAISLGNIRDLLLPGLNAVFGSNYDEFPEQWADIFEKNTSELSYERDVEVKMLGLAQTRAEGQSTAFEDMGEREMEFALLNARAMIEAMRVPTEEMLAAMDDSQSDRGKWHEAIDAALNEK